MAVDDTDTRKPRTSRPPRGPGVARPPAKERPPAQPSGAPQPRVTDPAVEAIVRAEHGDPFGYLGPHQAGEGVWEVRAMLPEARAAFVERDGESIPMERRHEAGFFVGRIGCASTPAIGS
jgi:1,4-alpha-glucan branching enzyme